MDAELKKLGIANTLITLGIGLAFIAVASFIYTVVAGLTKKHIPAVVGTVSALADYEKKDAMRHAVIIENYSNTVTVGQPPESADRVLRVTGDFSDGYLYVVADVEGQSLQTADLYDYDSVFAALVELKPAGNGAQIGGHLIESKGLETPKSPTHTEMLFRLSEVVYKKTYTDSDTELTSGDWLKVLNDPTTREMVIAFSSTIKGSGRIQKLVIYYTCAQGSNCSISVE